MALTTREVEYVAMLARLSLSEEEKQEMADQLSAVLDYMNKLNEVDTEGVAPLSHVLSIYNVFRADTPERNFGHDEIMRGAPDAEDGMFKVPRIV